MERKATSSKSIARDKYSSTGVKVVTTLEEVLTDEEVDLVVVTVKDPAHFEYSKVSTGPLCDLYNFVWFLGWGAFDIN